MNSACSLRIVKGKAVSSCPHAYNFIISAASKVSKLKACTNVPIQCRFCVEVHWKYNMRHHLRDWHPSWDSHISTADQDEFLAMISISIDEEIRLCGTVTQAQALQGQDSNPSPKSSLQMHINGSDTRRVHPSHIPPISDPRMHSPRQPRQHHTFVAASILFSLSQSDLDSVPLHSGFTLAPLPTGAPSDGDVFASSCLYSYS